MATVPCPACGRRTTVCASMCPECGGQITFARPRVVGTHPKVSLAIVVVCAATLAFIYAECRHLPEPAAAAATGRH